MKKSHKDDTFYNKRITNGDIYNAVRDLKKGMDSIQTHNIEYMNYHKQVHQLENEKIRGKIVNLKYVIGVITATVIGIITFLSTKFKF